MDTPIHISVMPNEVIESFTNTNGLIYIDATFGMGGHTKRMLEHFPNSKVLAIDRDPNVSKFAESFLRQFPERFSFTCDKMSTAIPKLIASQSGQIDGIIIDSGISSMQLEGLRGFSYMNNGQLDMTMGSNDINAYQLINHYSQSDIAKIIRDFGEERAAKAVAKAIVEARINKAIETTLELREIIRSAVGAKYCSNSIFSRVFQGIRIAVNDELNELRSSLQSITKFISVKTVLSVISFHSLEDRIVKNFFKEVAGKNIKPITPSDNELINNTRSRSAKLRSAIINPESNRV